MRGGCGNGFGYGYGWRRGAVRLFFGRVFGEGILGLGVWVKVLREILRDLMVFWFMFSSSSLGYAFWFALVLDARRVSCRFLLPTQLVTGIWIPCFSCVLSLEQVPLPRTRPQANYLDSFVHARNISQPSNPPPTSFPYHKTNPAALFLPRRSPNPRKRNGTSQRPSMPRATYARPRTAREWEMHEIYAHVIKNSPAWFLASSSAPALACNECRAADVHARFCRVEYLDWAGFISCRFCFTCENCD